jgi:hypothetical protein
VREVRKENETVNENIEILQFRRFFQFKEFQNNCMIGEGVPINKLSSGGSSGLYCRFNFWME